MGEHRDTIFALSSGRPPAAIGVVRVSGSKASEALRALTRHIPMPRRATLLRLRDPVGGEPIDDALVLWMPGPRSETGEDTVEFHIHGGRAVLAATLTALANVPGLRSAGPGEFTRRAFTNGKLDLTAVEGLADLIGADTEAQRRQALRLLKGLLGKKAEQWRARLIEALALVEALIDFPDEGDVPPDLLTPALTIASALRREIAQCLADNGRGERLRDGLTVAIAGPVNVGKSSILNRLARRAVAIVSPYAGTTRDVIEVHLDLAGYPVTVLDTAGLRDTGDPVEQEGVRRARERAADADLVLWIVDATETEPRGPPTAFNKTDMPTVWVVANKRDLAEKEAAGSRILWQGRRQYYVSAETGESFDALVDGLKEFAEEFFGTIESSVITRQRHRDILTSCAACLERAVGQISAGREDIIAEELRLAARELGRLTGRVDVEEVLDTIFRDFCIGK